MIRLALAGGIGSGKSTVAGLLRDLGCVVIDADEVAQQVVVPGSPGLEDIVRTFGQEVLSPSGTLDRAALGRIVFAESARRLELESIVHPRVAARTAELIAQCPDDAIVVVETPLLAEVGRRGDWDAVIVVDCPDEVRLQRLVQSRGMDLQDALRRMSAQVSRDERLALADVVIDNSGPQDTLRDRVSSALHQLTGAART